MMTMVRSPEAKCETAAGSRARLMTQTLAQYFARERASIPMQANGPAGGFLLTGERKFQVPVGRRLVIEEITGSVEMEAAEALECLVVMRFLGCTLTQNVPFEARRMFEGGGEYVSAVRIRLAAEAGTTVSISISRGGNAGPWKVDLTASGYLVTVAHS